MMNPPSQYPHCVGLHCANCFWMGCILFRFPSPSTVITALPWHDTSGNSDARRGRRRYPSLPSLSLTQSITATVSVPVSPSWSETFVPIRRTVSERR